MSESLPVPARASSRHYGMDWLRIGAFVLLILYHVGLVFSPWPYELKAVRTYPWTAYPLLLLNAWRLSLLFAISGYASAAVLERASGTGSFLRSRLARLGIPLLFAMAVIVPPQPWVWLTMAMGYDHSFIWFMVHDYFTFRNMDGIDLPGWMHMWFVVYLLAYTMVLSGLSALPGHVRKWLHRAGERALAGPLLLPAGAAIVYLARRGPDGWSDTHRFINDFAAHATYLPVFLFGALLRRSEPLQSAIVRQWKLAVMLAVTAYLVVIACEFVFPAHARDPGGLHQVFLVARAVQGWGTIIALFGIADIYGNRDGRWRAPLAEAVFPFYIVHQSLILVIGYGLRPYALAPLAEFAILVVGTALGCALFYVIGRSIGPLRPLIGLKRKATMPQAPVEPPPGADPSAAPA